MCRDPELVVHSVELGVLTYYLKEVVTPPSLWIIMVHGETKTIPIHMSIVTEACRYKLGTPILFYRVQKVGRMARFTRNFSQIGG